LEGTIVKRILKSVVSAACVLAFGASAFAGNAAEAVGDPVLELPTLRSLGMYWVVKGDDNGNGKVELAVRKVGTQEWKKAPALWRVEKGAHKNKKGKSSVNVPEGAWLFAGSALMLEAETGYEMKVTLVDPDGGGVEKVLKQSTIAEPVAPKGMAELHVVPGDGGGKGTAADPLKGIKAAMAAAKPGTILLFHKGIYDGPVVIDKSGEPGKPIIWRAAGDGVVMIDGKCPPDKREGAAIDLVGQHDIWFEGIAVANTWNCFKAHGAQNIVVRRCHMHDCNVGFFATVNEPRVMTGFFIADNVVEGTGPWPSTAQDWNNPPESRGIWVGGQGHVVAYNRVRNMKDGLTTAETIPCSAIDFHNNEISDMVDDGAELDGSERNTRNFLNRYTNMLTGISFQPVYGGPAYAFKNVLYNFRTEAFKLHNTPSGAIMVNNTCVHRGEAWWVVTQDPIKHSYSRNNIFIGTDGPAIRFEPEMIGNDFDFDGFGGWSGGMFMKWSDKRFATPEEVKAGGPVEKNLILLEVKDLFASGAGVPEKSPTWDIKNEEGYGTMNLVKVDGTKIDLRLKAGSKAEGAGVLLEGYGDVGGKAYLGAYAPGSELPWYGPRVEKK
jgi:hypothetical protein